MPPRLGARPPPWSALMASPSACRTLERDVQSCGDHLSAEAWLLEGGTGQCVVLCLEEGEKRADHARPVFGSSRTPSRLVHEMKSFLLYLTDGESLRDGHPRTLEL